MMDKNHRDVFFNLSLGIQLLLHEAFGTELENEITHIMVEINRLSSEYNAEDGEMLAIVHNAGQVIQGKLPLDIDQCIERNKLYTILRDTKLTDLIPPPETKINGGY
jgi:hypothetical protein